MKELPFIVSLAYKDELGVAAQQLNHIGINHFSIYLLFKNGETLVLTDRHELAIPYYTEKIYVADKNLKPSTHISTDVHIRGNSDLLTSIEDYLGEKFNFNWCYYLVRQCVDCTVILGAGKEEKLSDYKDFYEKTYKIFEDFMVDFFNKHLTLFKTHSHGYQGASFLKDESYRRKTIKNCLDRDERSLSKNELACLYWSALGKSAEEISIITGLKKLTVEFYRKQSIKKLHCSNITHAVYEATIRGLFTCFTNNENSIIHTINSHKVLPTDQCSLSTKN